MIENSWMRNRKMIDDRQIMPHCLAVIKWIVSCHCPWKFFNVYLFTTITENCKDVMCLGISGNIHLFITILCLRATSKSAVYYSCVTISLTVCGIPCPVVSEFVLYAQI